MNSRFFPGDPANPLPPAVYRDDPYWVHGLFTLLVMIAIVIGVLLIVRMLVHRPHQGGAWSHWGQWGHGPRTPALDELDLRYARGDIGRDEFLTRRSDLLHRPGDGPPAGTPPATG